MNPISRNAILATLLVTVMVLGIPLTTAANNSPRKVIIGFRDTPGLEQRQLIEGLGGHVSRMYSMIPALAAEIPSGAAQQLLANPSVTYIETDYVRTPMGHIVPGVIYDGSYEILPWGVERVNANDVWDANNDLMVDDGAIAGLGVRVAVLDTGLDYPDPTAHPDLAGNVDFSDSWDFLDNDGNVSDTPGPVTGHGTATSGIVAAIDNNIGVIGVAPKATVIMYRVCDSSVNECPDSAIIDALEESVIDNADVVSMSFGGIAFSIPFKLAIHAAYVAGLVLVASSGNTPSVIAGARHYPSGFSEVIAVGATDINNNLATFSTFGGHLELVAPGVDTPTTTLVGFGRDVLLHENSPVSQDIQANPMVFSGTGSLTKDLVYAGLGRAVDFATVDCTDKIAIISRGAITFRLKVENAYADGCLAAVIFNSVAGNFFGTLGVPQAIPAVSISRADGLALVAALGSGPVNVSLTVVALDYDSFSGTSASAPYVSGVAALVLSANSGLDPKDVRKILRGTAVDLGIPGRDIYFGYGLVDAYAAVQCATGATTC